MSIPFLSVSDLKTSFPVRRDIFGGKRKRFITAVDGVSFELQKGETLGLVGESGCGKSTLARSIMRLTSNTTGSIVLDGKKIDILKGRNLKTARSGFQMIFQDPLASLNPRMTVFDILSEPLLCHRIIKKSNLLETISALMLEAGLSPKDMKKYPHEFSGGQCQRIAIARALAMKPKLLIADEPVSALDVSIQSQILNLLLDLKKKHALTMIFISHDLGVIKHIADRTAVMYLGKIVESGSTGEIFETPKHPYTGALLSAIPLPDPDREKKREKISLPGEPPSMINPPAGCRFHPRCLNRQEKCSISAPLTEKTDKNRQIACFFPLM